MSYKHHELVAPLPRFAQQELLRDAERRNLGRRDFQTRISAYKKASLSVPLMPQEVYSVLYADPPWEIEALILNKWQDRLPYSTLSLEELKSLPLPKLADDCVLFLWSTLTTLPQALELLTSWGFCYHTTITWDKGNGWCMCGFHRKSELLLVGYQGSISRVIKQEGVNIPTVFYEAKTMHSTKPQTMYALIEERTVGKRIELFARHQRPGWDAWGNEV